jgi:predicted ABC-type ATPase
MPELYMIGGANGSGKTTVALALLPNLLDIYLRPGNCQSNSRGIK